MLIPHPLLGLRDASEFTYLGDAALMDRPVVNDVADMASDSLLDAFHDYQHLRVNPAGLHRELWFHEQGDRSWLVVTRNTVTHEIVDCQLARNIALNKEPTSAGNMVGRSVHDEGSDIPDSDNRSSGTP